jgi:DNA processing protein
MDDVVRECEALSAAGGWMLLWGEPNYPEFLRDLPDAPIVISGLGDVQVLSTRMLGIVGNRSASLAGLETTRTLATQLAQKHITVVSGLARGVDTAAHTGALQGGGPTVAVIAGGINHVYPPENAKLREDIIANGCVLSEQPWGSAPTASLFPRRNRIIAGLGVGVLVSEATRHSGSLITAEYALNYGRDVWAIPGAPADPRSGGPNWLLKQGATLVEGVEDILSSLPATPAPYLPKVARSSPAQPTLFEAPASPEEVAESSGDSPALEEALSTRQKVFALLSGTPIAFDSLIRQIGLPEADLSALLVELELDGHATREPDGRWRR